MLRAGLIGFPATGKTTLFRLMTRAVNGQQASHDRTHATVGVARVPDERLDRLAALFTPRKVVPATVELADIAGRTGPRALLEVAPFRQADALLHVVRMFRDETVPHPSGAIDPLRDAQAMEDELILADLDVAERRLDRVAHDLKKGDHAELRAEQSVLERCRAALVNGTPLRALSLESEAAKHFRGFQLLSAKPLLVVINLDESDLPRVARSTEIARLEEFLSGATARAVAVCAKIELEIAQLEHADAAAFLADLGLQEPGLDRVIRASYELLGYLSFFTIGDDECRAWPIPCGTPAQAAAREIHSDMARGFIRAEVVGYNHLMARGSLAACREHGEVRLEGKDYIVRDGDVVNFRFAT